MKGGAVGPRKFFNAQIWSQFPFDQFKDGIELRMCLDVLENDLIQVGHGSRNPIQDSGLGLEQLVESGFVFWMTPRPPIIGIKVGDWPRSSALPIQERINARQPFTTQLEEKHFTGFRAPPFQGRVAGKPERNPRFQVQDLATEHHLSMAGQGKVDVMEVITFLLPATAPFGANLSVEDADEVDSQSFQQVKLNVSRLSVENGSPNCAGSCAGRVFKFHDFAIRSFINPYPVEPARMLNPYIKNDSPSILFPVSFGRMKRIQSGMNQQ